MLAQVSSMALIGLWHGITWNFLIWGLWHGIGLFVHNQWMQFTKSRSPFAAVPAQVSTMLTFAYVSLGWVWFALPEPDDAIRVLRTLFGLSA
jgi:alginate O-acetyltransferase complex protein AlgI